MLDASRAFNLEGRVEAQIRLQTLNIYLQILNVKASRDRRIELRLSDCASVFLSSDDRFYSCWWRRLTSLERLNRRRRFETILVACIPNACRAHNGIGLAVIPACLERIACPAPNQPHADRS